MNKYVIDRESNLPIDTVEDVEPYEVDENRQVQLRDFWKTIGVDTSDLIAFSHAAINTDLNEREDRGIQTYTTKPSVAHKEVQAEPVTPLEDFYV